MNRHCSFRNFYALLLILTSIAAVLFFAGAARSLRASSDNMYPEAAGVLAAQRWAGGLPLYEDYRQPPSLITHFPPLWYGFLAVFVKAGVSSLDALTLLGRCLSITFLLGVAGLGYVWNRRLGIDASLALMTPVFYLAFPILLPWGVTARPDFPGLFFAFAAVCLVGVWPSKASVCWGGAAAAVAFLIRHNAVAAQVSIVVWLLWRRRWVDAFLFCACWTMVVLPALVTFQKSSHGYLLLNLSGAKFGALAPTYSRDALFRLLVSPGNGFATALFIFGILGLILSWSDRDPRWRLAGIYLAISFALATLGAAAAGAAVNHYLEPALATAVLVPVGLSRLRGAWSETPLAWLALVGTAVLLLPSIDMQRSNITGNPPQNLTQVSLLMQDHTAFTDIPYLAARKPTPEFLDLVSLTYAERTGGWAGWTSRPLVDALREKKYDLVILHEPADVPYDPAARYPRYPRLDGAVRKAITENYAYCFDLEDSYVYQRLSDGGGNCAIDPNRSRQQAHATRNIARD